MYGTYHETNISRNSIGDDIHADPTRYWSCEICSQSHWKFAKI